MSLKPHKPMATAVQALGQRWRTLSTREQSLLSWVATLLAMAVVWWLALAPALRTVREAPAQQAAVDAQWQQLKDLQAQAQSLKQQPRMKQAEALRALQNTTTELLDTSAQLQTLGDRSTVTLKAVPAPALATWLVQVRTQARAVPVQAHLKLSAAAWSGSVVLSLPAP